MSKGQKKENASVRPMTLAGCLEAMLNAYKEGKKTGLARQKKFVCDTLEISEMQAVLLAAIIELTIGNDANAQSVAQSLGCTNLSFISMKPDLDALVEKRYVRVNTFGFRGVTYDVPEFVISKIQKNEKPDDSDIQGLSTTPMLRRINRLYRNYWRDIIDNNTLRSEVTYILSNNLQNVFMREFMDQKLHQIDDAELVLFMFLVVRMAGFNETRFAWDEYARLFTDFEEDDMRENIESGETELQKKGLVEFVNNDGIVDNSHICLSDHAVKAFLAEVSLDDGQKPCKNLKSHKSINEKKLFFNDEERRQVDRLADLLRQENFVNIVGRLKEKGFRSGFNCLFYGTAGTGKTETALQIARLTGRDVFLVDVTELKSKWVGDSEKNVKALFDDYRRLVRASEVAPILLFNEADAIFGMRKKGAESAVDKMENSIQNIILQELETIEGILIATTNLTENFCDDAFERRFIYKIQFNKPGQEAKAKIWESLVEGLDEESANALAGEFDFSGGQIENISRKMTVDYILSGQQPGLSGIRELCAQEVLGGSRATKPRTRIGF